MPAEMRKIVFSTKETLNALRIFCKLSDQDFPSDDGLDVDVVEDGEVKVELKNADGHLRTFNSREVAVGLLQLCKKMGVPTPKRASKIVGIYESRVALVLKMD